MKALLEDLLATHSHKTHVDVFAVIHQRAKDGMKQFDHDRADHAILQIKEDIAAGRIAKDGQPRAKLIKLLVYQAQAYFRLVNGFGKRTWPGSETARPARSRP